METEEHKTKKISKKNVNKNSATYIRQRQKANERKHKYLNNLTSEQRQLKRAKDREYYQKRKATNKTKCINEMSEREKCKQRAQWKKNSKNYRQNKKNLINIVNDNNPLLRKDSAKAYHTISKQNIKIKHMQMKIDSLKKKLERQKRQDRKLKTYSHIEPPPNSKVNNLIRHCNVVADVSTDAKRRICLITPEIRSKIVYFFEKDEVSRMCPEKRDFIRRGVIKKQKRILLDTIKDLHLKFTKDTGIKLSYVTFLREKPFWVINPTSKDRDTCLCIRHENFVFMVKKLFRVSQLNYGHVSKIIEDFSCDVKSYDCMFSLCSKCKKIPMITMKNDQDLLNYFQWQSTSQERLIRGKKKTVKIMKKVFVTSSIKELKDKLIEDIPAMKKHIYGIYYHNKVKDEVQKTLQKNELMIQIHFSENYVTKYDRKIQSTHFGASAMQLTIHTGVYYYKDETNSFKTSSFATISDCLDHQAHAVWGHLRPILSTILSDKEHIDTLLFFSDGPTSQYRNRTNIYLWIKNLVENYKQIIKAAWFYSEPGHRKGPMDEIGRYLKRTADKHVLMGKNIKSAEDFIKIFKDSTIMLKNVTNEEICSIKNTVPKKMYPVPGKLSTTRITWQKEFRNVIKIDQHGENQKEIVLNISFNKDKDVNERENSQKFDININIDLIKSITFKKFKQKGNLNSRKSIDHEVNSPLSSEDEDLITVRRKKEQERDMDAGTSYANDFKENIHPNKINPGVFLLINVPTNRKNTFYRYVAIAETCVDEEGEIRVTFLKSLRNNAKDFKVDYKDVSYVKYEQVIKIIPKPKTIQGASPSYHFHNDMDIFEKF